MITLAQSLLFLFLPSLFVFLEKKYPQVFGIGPVLPCYALGFLLGLVPGIQFQPLVVEYLPQVSILLSMTLLLFSADLKCFKDVAGKYLFSFSLALIAICISTTVVTLFIFKDFDMNWKVAGMLTGVYSGGTPNLNAIGMGLQVNPTTIFTMNAADMAISSGYLFLLLFIGPKFAQFLGFCKETEKKESEVENSFKSSDRRGIKEYLPVILSAFAVIGISVGLSLVIKGKMDQMIILVTCTALALLVSLKRPREFGVSSHDAGQYLLYVFCLTLGLGMDASALSQNTGNIFLFVTVTFLITITLHYVFNYFGKVDGKTSIMTNVAAVFGPPFVPAVAKKLGGEGLLVSGIICALIGNAVGNYLGLMMAYFLKSIN